MDDTAAENDLQINITSLALIVTIKISSAFEHHILGVNMSYRVSKTSTVCVAVLYCVCAGWVGRGFCWWWWWVGGGFCFYFLIRFFEIKIHIHWYLHEALYMRQTKVNRKEKYEEDNNLYLAV